MHIHEVGDDRIGRSIFVILGSGLGREFSVECCYLLIIDDELVSLLGDRDERICIPCLPLQGSEVGEELLESDDISSRALIRTARLILYTHGPVALGLTTLEVGHHLLHSTLRESLTCEFFFEEIGLELIVACFAVLRCS